MLRFVFAASIHLSLFLVTVYSSSEYVWRKPEVVVNLDLSGNDWRLSSNDNLTVIDGASVPGGVWDNLYKHNVIGNPLWRTNDQVYANVSTGKLGGWSFVKKFSFPSTTAAAIRNGGSVILEISGVQTLAQIRFNGKLLTNTNNMFRQYQVFVPTNVLQTDAFDENKIEISFARVPAPLPKQCPDPAMLRARDESDAWGWDWSPSLNPIAISGSVRLVVIPKGTLHLVSFSPSISVISKDASGLPESFLVNASLELVSSPHKLPLNVTLRASGDWGTRVTTSFSIPSFISSSAVQIYTTNVVLTAHVPDIELWWPLHYGSPNLHEVSVNVSWDSIHHLAMTKRIGFRSVSLYTGKMTAPAAPLPVDPQHALAYVGCFLDGNIYWGGRQHALPNLVGVSDSMTVSKCIKLCTNTEDGNYTLAGLQDGTHCFCGVDIGNTCPGCFPKVGTPADPSECGSVCGGNTAVACGGASYMWGTSSVYNLTVVKSTRAGETSLAHPNKNKMQLLDTLPNDGSGDSGFAIVINGQKVFSRGANLVPFELLESTVDNNYVRRTVRSARDAGMNMLRVWGGGTYQNEAFYDECDRLGVLIYHDMMFSFRLYPDDAEFKANVRSEILFQVQRLRHHPSIVLWDTSNENEGEPDFFFRTVLAEIAAHDETRPIWPASPSSGFSSGVYTDTGLPNGRPLIGRFAGSKSTLDTHQPYNFCKASSVTSKQLNQSTYFKSEFGQVSLPSFETLEPVLNGTLGDFGVFSPVMVHRKHAGSQISKPIISLFGKKTNFSDVSKPNFRRVIFLSQLAQALCIKTFLEELRRGHETYGALIWQLNDVWQAASWGSLDYGGRWRMLHHLLQRLLSPTVVSVWLDNVTLKVYGSHHGSPLVAKSRVEINITNIKTAQTRVHKVVEVPWGGSVAEIRELWKFPLTNVNISTEIVTTRVLDTTASETVHLLTPPVDMDWIRVDTINISVIQVTNVNATVVLTNTALSPLFYVTLTSSYHGRFDQNMLFIVPNESKVITFFMEESAMSSKTKADTFVPEEDFRSSLNVDWFNRLT